MQRDLRPSFFFSFFFFSRFFFISLRNDSIRKPEAYVPDKTKLSTLITKTLKLAMINMLITQMKELLVKEHSITKPEARVPD